MARQRRGPELRGTLGTLLRTTLAQAGNLRDALERGAREGRSRVEDALAGRRRSDALAQLGEIVLDLLRRGEIDVDELPEIRDVVAHLDELDARADDDDDAEDEGNVGRAARVAPAPGPVHNRFDTRRSERDGTVSSTWAPPAPTVSAPAATTAAARARVWRPHVDPAPSPEPAAPAHPPSRPRGGGIRFDDDDDLADYMHPDDVPKKPDP